jgi:hypothetical protein
MYTCNGWYEYGVNKLLINMDEISKIFPERKFLSTNDIIEHVIHVDPGMCIMLTTLLNNLKSILGEIERKIRNGKMTTATIIPTLNSVSIDVIIDNIHDALYLNTFVRLIKEDLYLAYFVDTDPDIPQQTPLPPTFTDDLNVTCKISNKKGLTEMLNGCINYLNTLESYHSDIIRLLHNTNTALEKILYDKK